MYRLDARQFVEAVRILGRIDGIFFAADRGEHNPKKTDTMSDISKKSGKDRNDALVALLTDLRLPVTLASAKRLSEKFDNVDEPIAWEDVLKSYEHIASRLMDELSAVKIFCLDRETGQYFESEVPLFGQGVADKLPLAIPDIEDAGKCLALRQGTAAVFHLMRVMEAALKELARLIDIPYAPSWESYIKQITEKVSQQHKHKGIKWKHDEPFFKEVLGDLQAIKIAWRNPTMHIVRRYSVDEADDIFRAVRGFTKRLESKLKLPKSPARSA
jgi:hypothetical protein